MDFDAGKIIATLKRINKSIIDSSESIKSQNSDSRSNEIIDILGELAISMDRFIIENNYEIQNFLKLDPLEEVNFNQYTFVLNRMLNSIITQGGLSQENDIVTIFQSIYFIRQIIINSIKRNDISVYENDLTEDGRQERRSVMDEIKKFIVETKNQFKTSSDLIEELSNAKSKIEDTLSEIISKERDANTAAINAASFAADAQSALSKTNDYSNTLVDSIVKKDELFGQFEMYRIQVSDLIENLNRIGLAGSFGERRKALSKTGYGWMIVFLLGIFLLSLLGYCEILPLLKIGSPDPTAIAARFLVGAPLVWLTWFGARQYGHNLRLREDYAFKEAAAMAFVGYRNEMSKDEAMLKLLQESAIKTFASNPLDAISKRDEAASPIHELLEKSLSKLDPQKIVDSITTLLKSEKSK